MCSSSSRNELNGRPHRGHVKELVVDIASANWSDGCGQLTYSLSDLACRSNWKLIRLINKQIISTISHISNNNNLDCRMKNTTTTRTQSLLPYPCRTVERVMFLRERMKIWLPELKKNGRPVRCTESVNLPGGPFSVEQRQRRGVVRATVCHWQQGELPADRKNTWLYHICSAENIWNILATTKCLQHYL